MRPALARLLTLVALLIGLMPLSAAAQSPFAAALYVNDSGITNYEITQRMRFLEFIGASGENPRDTAIERLIEERLMLSEAQRLGGRMTPDQIDAGMSEFAMRAQLSTDEMVTRLGQAGVDRETFVEFIRAGVMWRELIRTLYGRQVAITESQIDQALSVEGVQPVIEVQISEIFLPGDAQFAEAVARIVPQVLRIRTETEFANAARQVSVAPSAPQGGRVDRWVAVDAIPAPVGPVLATAAVGTVVGPLEMPGALAFFQLRARRDSRAVPAASVLIDYRRVSLPGGRSEANLARIATLRDDVDGCVDFDGEVLRAFPELPETAVQQLSVRQPALSAAERTELERLNPGQISANLVQDGALTVMILCSRTVAAEGVPTREAVRGALVNRALEGQAALYLQRLRAEADIRRP